MKLRPTLALMSLLSIFSLLFASSRADTLKVGDPAPAVTATTEAGTKLNLADVYKKQPYTLVYFYPKADTGGCTAQSCSLRDAYEQLTKHGIAVIGVSHDKVEDQKAFKEKHRLPFTLLADTDQTASKAFGVPNYPGSGLAHRSAYLIKDGKIVYTDYEGTTDEQAKKILEVVGAKKS